MGRKKKTVELVGLYSGHRAEDPFSPIESGCLLPNKGTIEDASVPIAKEQMKTSVYSAYTNINKSSKQFLIFFRAVCSPASQ